LIPASHFFEYTMPANPKQKRKDKWRFTLVGADWFCSAGIMRADAVDGGRTSIGIGLSKCDRTSDWIVVLASMQKTIDEQGGRARRVPEQDVSLRSSLSRPRLPPMLTISKVHPLNKAREVPLWSA
jgi:hypothetical protein